MPSTLINGKTIQFRLKWSRQPYLVPGTIFLFLFLEGGDGEVFPTSPPEWFGMCL